jgi:Asp-tRNA(Asn)/Glu-tRNA(Gln) amidotransferase A subunit family amidase
MMLSDDVLYLPVSELGRRIHARKLSPVILAESYLARSERLNPQLNAYATLTRDLALEQAHAAEKRSALAIIVARCTEFPTLRKTCSRRKGIRRHGARNRTRTRLSITMRQ